MRVNKLNPPKTHILSWYIIELDVHNTDVQETISTLPENKDNTTKSRVEIPKAIICPKYFWIKKADNKLINEIPINNR